LTDRTSKTSDMAFGNGKQEIRTFGIKSSAQQRSTVEFANKEEESCT